MRACSDHVKVGETVVAVVRPEPGALCQDGFDREGRSVMRVELVAEIEGREVPDRRWIREFLFRFRKRYLPPQDVL